MAEESGGWGGDDAARQRGIGRTGRRRAGTIGLAVLVAGAVGIGVAFGTGAFKSGPGNHAGPAAQSTVDSNSPSSAGSGSSALSQGTVRMFFAPSRDLGGISELAAAVAMVNKRLKAAGLPQAQLAPDGKQFVVVAPGTDRGVIVRLVRSGHLVFRPVLQSSASTGGSGGWQLSAAPDETAASAAYAALHCDPAAPPADASDTGTGYLATCSANSPEKYLLGPSLLDGTQIMSAQPTQNATGGWQVNLTFDAAGAKAFADATQQLYTQYVGQTGTGQFAVVLDGIVESAPAVTEGPITGGQAQISGEFTGQQARDLAAVFAYGALPVDFSLVEADTLTPTN